MEWLAWSQDLTSMVNFWECTARDEYKTGRQYDKADRLIEAINITMTNVTYSKIWKLFQNMYKLAAAGLVKIGDHKGCLTYYVLNKFRCLLGDVRKNFPNVSPLLNHALSTKARSCSNSAYSTKFLGDFRLIKCWYWARKRYLPYAL